MPFPIHLLLEIPKLIMAVFGTDSIQDAIDSLSVDMYMKQGLLFVENNSDLPHGEFIKRELQRPTSQALAQYNTILFYMNAIAEIQQQFIILTNEKNRITKIREYVDMLTQAALDELARIDNLLEAEVDNQYLLERKQLLQNYLDQLSNLGKSLTVAQAKFDSINNSHQAAQVSLNNVLNNLSKESSQIYQTAHQEHINNIGEQISAINQRTVSYENNLALAQAELASLSQGRQPNDPVVMQAAAKVENYQSMVKGLKEIEQVQKEYQQEEKDTLERRVDFNEKTPADLKALGISPKEATESQMTSKGILLNEIHAKYGIKKREQLHIQDIKQKTENNPLLGDEVIKLDLTKPQYSTVNENLFQSLLDKSDKEISEIKERLKSLENQKVEAQNEVDQIKSDMNDIAKKLGKPEFKDENKPQRPAPPQPPQSKNNFPHNQI